MGQGGWRGYDQCESVREWLLRISIGGVFWRFVLMLRNGETCQRNRTHGCDRMRYVGQGRCENFEDKNSGKY